MNIKNIHDVISMIFSHWPRILNEGLMRIYQMGEIGIWQGTAYMMSRNGLR